VLIVKKSLNSSIVLVEQNGHEVILFGKGIGYGKKPGEKIKSDDVSQVFMPVDNLFTKQLIDSTEESPYDLDKNHKVNVETHLVM
jgi:beta-glucoside operon transcriptional antiterminator